MPWLVGLVERAWPELQEASPGREAHPVTHQTSASRKEAKNKAVVKKGGGVGPGQAGAQRKI